MHSVGYRCNIGWGSHYFDVNVSDTWELVGYNIKYQRSSDIELM